MNPLDRINVNLHRVMVVIAGIFLLAMCLLTCANIVLRIVWVPVPGTYELMGYFGAVVAALSLGHTQMRRGHVAVDVLINRLSSRRQRFLKGFNGLACMLFFSLAAWQLMRKALVLRASGEVTETLRIIYYPFALAVALGCVLLALVLLADLVQALRPSDTEKPR
ncbi:MAG: TRAP transporter small permease [Deltaproteobacteria bacterium]|nr:TRAP transporter small permease [Deltaproteobacteria bacterium]MBW2357097.1 TRAP transporter small permease [Deltaproteobacteria bacterium]